jgi:FMN phosphatase YigB (HAD superfamily)
MANKKTLLIDFDGVLHDYHGWTGLTDVGKPIEKSRKALILLSREYKLICFSTRPAEIIEPWLRHWGFPPMEVTSEKKPAHLIIDDRAIQFKGEWTDELLEQIRQFKPHWSLGENKVDDNASSSNSPS